MDFGKLIPVLVAVAASAGYIGYNAGKVQDGRGVALANTARDGPSYVWPDATGPSATAPIDRIANDDNIIAFVYGATRRSIFENVTLDGGLVVASFDYDNTLGKPIGYDKGERSWSPEGRSCSASTYLLPGTKRVWWWTYREWKPTFDTVPAKLAELHDAGSIIVIQSNQWPVNTQISPEDLPPRDKRTAWIEKLVEFGDYVTRSTGRVVPMIVMGGVDKDTYNKPCLGMWQTFMSLARAAVGKDATVNCKDSIYVGDAAGRLRGTTTADTDSDFSSGDFQYAVSMGLEHRTPEQVFAGAVYPPDEDLDGCKRLPADMWCGEFTPKTWCNNGVYPTPGMYDVKTTYADESSDSVHGHIVQP